MESVHSSVGDEHSSKVALPTIAPREMSEALGGECLVLMQLVFLVVVLMIVLLAGDIESDPGLNCVI